MSAPLREPYETKDGKRYALWNDINDLMHTLVPIYWRETREGRQQLHHMFRGQASAKWGLLPTLYRPPTSATIVDQRKRYTESFMNDLAGSSHTLGLVNLSETKLHAIAQHYGFYTELLDFTFNVEVAAYFATYTDMRPKIGALFAFSIEEYQELRNPLAALGTSIEEDEKLLGTDALPPCIEDTFDDVPRIHRQQGIFIRCPLGRDKAIRECIDRYYFHQRQQVVYLGDFGFRSGLAGPHLFATKSAYEAYLDLARKEHPELFVTTSPFGAVDLFPPVDPVSMFANEWKHAHPDPTIGCAGTRPRFLRFFNSLFRSKRGESAPIPPEVSPTRFATAVEEYYFDPQRRSPYDVSYVGRGREMMESLCGFKELDNPENVRWLLWELLRDATEGKYRCTIRFSNRDSHGHVEEVLHLMVTDRWLESTYPVELSYQQAEQGLWHVRFDKLFLGRWDDKPEPKRATLPISQRKEHALSRGNPYRANAAVRQILESIRRSAKKLDVGDVGSFVYDLECVLIKEQGRGLEVLMGIGEGGDCCFCSPMIATQCAKGTQPLIIEIYDGFFQTLNRTFICREHWKHMIEGEMNLFTSVNGFPLGLA